MFVFCDGASCFERSRSTSNFGSKEHGASLNRIAGMVQSLMPEAIIINGQQRGCFILEFLVPSRVFHVRAQFEFLLLSTSNESNFHTDIMLRFIFLGCAKAL